MGIIDMTEPLFPQFRDRMMSQAEADIISKDKRLSDMLKNMLRKLEERLNSDDPKEVDEAMQCIHEGTQNWCRKGTSEEFQRIRALNRRKFSL